MIPVKLTLSGFLSYKDPVTLDFTAFDLACIAGPNGAGKSSLLDALTYALFGKARRMDETLINLASDAAFVELVFAYEGNVYRIQRTNPMGKSTILEFQIATKGTVKDDPAEMEWKPMTQRTVRDTQRSIEETLRLDYDTFINAAFFLQGNADQFTQQTPSRRKAILGSILGLDIWEIYRQQTADKRRIIEGEVLSIDGRLAEINGELSEEADRVSLLKTLHKDLDQLIETRSTQEKVLESVRKIQSSIDEQERFVETLGKQVDTTWQRVDQVAARRAARQAERDDIAAIQDREKEIRKGFEALQEARKVLEEWDAASREHETSRRAPLLEIEKARVRLETEIEQLTKEAAIAEDNEAELQTLKNEIANIQVELEPVKKQLKDRQRLEAELTGAQTELAEAQAENPRLRDEMDRLRNRMDQLETAPENEALCPVCGQPLSLEHRAELIESLRKEGTEKGDQFRNNSKVMKTVDGRVAEFKKEIDALKQFEARDRKLSDDLLLREGKDKALTAALKSWEKAGKKKLKEIKAELAAESFAPKARASLAEIDEVLKATGYDPSEHDRIKNLAGSGQEVEDAMRKLEMAAAALEPLDRELAELEKEAASGEKDLAEREKSLAEARDSLTALRADTPDVQQAQRDLLDMQERENQLRMKVGSAQQNVDVLENLRERKADLEVERESCARDIATHKQLERAFGKDGVPALLIEQAIPQIETKANEILERLSGGEMSVRFQTQRVLKSSDALRETLDITISDQAGVRDYEMYSGGEAFRVNFAVRLALSEVLARRAGRRLQTLVIDEGFGSQDEMGRQRLIEAINMVRADFEKVLVITHIEELKDAFPTRIEVEKGDEGSRVTVVNG